MMLRLFLLFTFTTSAGLGLERLFQITLHVVDDAGRPVAGVQTGVSWENAKATKPSERIKSDEGVTDQDGKVILSGKTFTSGISYGAKKENYYTAWGLRYHFTDTRLLRWQPWNPVIEIMLKRKRNPTPMYAKRQGAEIPVSGVDVGYDLLAGDWVSPYGRGKTTDMLFHAIGEATDNSNYRGIVTIIFPGQGNGLIPHEIPLSEVSPLRMPYEAPAEGYEPKFIWRSVRKYNVKKNVNEEYIDDSSKTKNFFVRVRSELDAEGRVVKAMYGKIHAPFIFDARGLDPWGTTKKQYVAFTYYVNPDGTRNIEYDPSRNLFKAVNQDDPSYRSLAP